jgi:PhnB protein
MAEVNSQRIVPMLVYKDAPAAIEFLCRVFGFEEKYRLPMPDGRVGHAELEYGGHRVTLSSEYPEMGLESPQEMPTRHMQLTCYVDDVDAHHAHSAAEGATILEPIEDQFYGDRTYRAVDSEGNRWIFSMRLREVSIDELEKAVAEMG